ncbi:DUF3180 domain-containing protein [Nocardioides zeae]|uniref:DUF3180 domain-containing protein n=1 Tax=Nocardioides imazamoxiresistens TaxID=3231893 RepID=A0ABU3PZX9_9ACTN|nr:DUF3180 domain-containing protein [Nocardioides zeae]MDT9594704.1 DUF3180 domain-containing protein [Nocardioides zeae]
MRPLGPGVLTGWLVVGLVGGWLVRRALGALDVAVPAVSWTQVLVLAFVAAVLAGTAYATRRSVERTRAELSADHAVNRLVLARASALVGALLLGGYAGHAVSWMGAASQVADERMLRALVAALAGAAVLVAALLLERACRVRSGPPAA